MGQRMPPVPPANRSPKGVSPEAPETDPATEKAQSTKHDERTRNLEQQGRQGNIKQNTRHPGYQQDR